MVAVRQSTARTTAAWAGVLFLGLYTVGVPFLTLTDTCTMGGDGLLPELIIAVPLATLATVLLALATTARSKSVRVGVIALALLFGLYLVPQILSVSILGHHYCGEEYDAYLQYSQPVNRWLPFAQLLLVISVVVIALRPSAHRDVA